ncbi:GreA/GreB family elongation factor [Salinimicrobium soli]|uniref:GreA/GreB family elongation factor n=1 Tax=Salinimicrobium soli TaxID=1254399 RepID=UPI003AAC9132
MSRGFVKEEDQEEAPFIPPRAALPAGVNNYVTPVGFQKLKQEKEELEKEWAGREKSSDKDRRIARAVVDGKLSLLNERINSARILDPSEQPPGEVRFGAHVKIRDQKSKKLQEFQIVGVDEANIKDQKIAFVAPIAKAITGKKVGEVAEFKLGAEIRHLDILEISYK